MKDINAWKENLEYVWSWFLYTLLCPAQQFLVLSENRHAQVIFFWFPDYLFWCIELKKKMLCRIVHLQTVDLWIVISYVVQVRLILGHVFIKYCINFASLALYDDIICLPIQVLSVHMWTQEWVWLYIYMYMCVWYLKWV